MADKFELFGTPHLVVMGMTLALCIGLPVLARKVNDPKLTRYIAWAFGAGVILNEFVYYVWAVKTYSTHDFLRLSLPFHVSAAGMYMTGIAALTRRQFIYEVAYYWVMIAMLLAVITPNLKEPFPTFRFIYFFVNHSGSVICIVFLTWGARMRPRFRSIFTVTGFTMGFFVFVGLMNWIIGSNYMFLCGEPTAQNPLFFLPWPGYILFLFPVGILFIIIMYSIHPITEFIKRKLDLDETREEG